MLPGDNDGVVGVEAAKLDGARDFIVVPVIHSFLMDDAKVQQYALHFIAHGSFIAENKRHALSAGEGKRGPAPLGREERGEGRGRDTASNVSLSPLPSPLAPRWAVPANGACPLFPGSEKQETMR